MILESLVPASMSMSPLDSFLNQETRCDHQRYRFRTQSSSITLDQGSLALVDPPRVFTQVERSNRDPRVFHIHVVDHLSLSQEVDVVEAKPATPQGGIGRCELYSSNSNIWNAPCEKRFETGETLELTDRSLYAKVCASIADVIDSSSAKLSTKIECAIHTAWSDLIAREEEHFKFLDLMKSAPKHFISERTAHVARRTWLSSKHAASRFLAIPAAGVGENRQILYSWDKADHHLEAEILENEPVEWFYRNSRTRKEWYEEVSLDTTDYPKALISYLQIFARRKQQFIY